MNKKELKQENIRLGTHGEDYGSWMSAVAPEHWQSVRL